VIAKRNIMSKYDLPVYVVHYTKLLKRKIYIENVLKVYFKKFKFIKKYDKEDLYLDQNEFSYEKNSIIFKNKIEELWEGQEAKYRELSNAEISCFLKHIEALKQASNSDYKYSLIIEDDVIISKNFYNKFNKLLKNIEKFEWDVIFLGSGIGRQFIFKKLKHKIFFSSPQIVSHPASNCADSYIIKKESAKILLKNLKTFHLSYDWEIAYQMYKLSFNVYWATRPLFEQGSKTGNYRSELR